MQNKLGFAIIGSGRMGMRRARTISLHPATRLICVSDTDEKKAKKGAEEFGCAYCIEPEEAINKPGVDCIVIGTPNKFHLPIAVAALQNGKHVFCEKPLARNPEEAARIVEAALLSKATLKVGSNIRHFPNVMKARELLDSSAIGEVLYLRAMIGVAGVHLAKSWFSDADLQGGGVFLDIGCHLFDLSRWFLGEVKSCMGHTSTMYWPVKPLEDNGMGIFEFANGKLAFLNASWMEWADYMLMEIYGTEGYLQIDQRMPNCTLALGKRNGQREVFDYTRQPAQSYDLEFQKYVSDLINQRQPAPSGFDGMRAVQMAHGVYESSRLGKKIALWGETEEKISQAYKAKG